MAASRKTFEVQTYSTDHWVLDRSFASEREARAYGKKLFATPRCEGYRVVRDWMTPEGRHFEAEVVTEFRPVSDALTVTPIEEAPICRSDAEFYGVESRMAINRLLRSYIERMVVTPTEIMHNYGEMRRLLERENLVPAALSRVASLQAGLEGDESRLRREQLNEVVARLTERARTAESLSDLPDLHQAGLTAMVGRLAERSTAEDREFLGRVVLCRELVQMRSWTMKLEFLLGLLETGDPADPPEPAALVDGVVADVVGAPPVIPELLGLQRNLLAEIGRLLELCQGQSAPPSAEGGRLLAPLSAAFAAGMLQETRVVVLDLIRRQVRSPQPLVRGNHDEEQQAFDQLLQCLSGPEGMIGGGPMAEALTFRFGRFLEAGGATGRRMAIAGILPHCRSLHDRLGFLLALSVSELGRQHRADIAGHLDQLVDEARRHPDFLPTDAPVTEALATVSRLYRMTMESGLEPADRERLAAALDDLLTDYVTDHRVVERFDPGHAPLRDRASHLLQLCMPEMLASPRALETVRQRVIAQLRQPDFQHHFVQDIADPAQAQQALREFYRLLSKAGFC